MYYAFSVKTPENHTKQYRFQSEQAAQVVQRYFENEMDPRYQPSQVATHDTDKKVVIVNPSDPNVDHYLGPLTFVGATRPAHTTDSATERAWFCNPEDVTEVLAEFEATRKRDNLASIPMPDALNGNDKARYNRMVKLMNRAFGIDENMGIRPEQTATEPANTRLELSYSCASANSHQTVVLHGAITQEQIDRISDKLIDGYQVVAPQVALPSPLEKALEAGDIPGYDETDHPLTDLSDWAEEKPTAASLHTHDAPTVPMSVADLTRAIETVSWNPMDESDRLGIPDENEEDSPVFY